MKKYFSITLATLALMIVFAGCGTTQTDKLTPDKTTPPKSDSLTIDIWDVAINGQSIVQSVIVQDQTKQEDGQVYVKINMTVKNTSNEKRIFMLGMCSPELDDLKGNKALYELFVKDSLDKVELEPGASATGDIYFKIPGDMNTNPSGMKLTFTYLGSREQPKVETTLK